jgi:hypothetical protein
MRSNSETVTRAKTTGSMTLLHSIDNGPRGAIQRV